jgi:hypothetical protein
MLVSLPLERFLVGAQLAPRVGDYAVSARMDNGLVYAIHTGKYPV